MMVITGCFDGIMHSRNGFLLVLLTGILCHNCKNVSASEICRHNSKMAWNMLRNTGVVFLETTP